MSDAKITSHYRVEANPYKHDAFSSENIHSQCGAYDSMLPRLAFSRSFMLFESIHCASSMTSIKRLPSCSTAPRTIPTTNLSRLHVRHQEEIIMLSCFTRRRGKLHTSPDNRIRCHPYLCVPQEGVEGN